MFQTTITTITTTSVQVDFITERRINNEQIATHKNATSPHNICFRRLNRKFMHSRSACGLQKYLMVNKISASLTIKYHKTQVVKISL